MGDLQEILLGAVLYDGAVWHSDEKKDVVWDLHLQLSNLSLAHVWKHGSREIKIRIRIRETAENVYCCLLRP